MIIIPLFCFNNFCPLLLRLVLGFIYTRSGQSKESKMSRSLGIPVKLLHEAAGHIVTVELKSGELYRGNMIECEDNWNCQLESITYTAKVLAFLSSPASTPLPSLSLLASTQKRCLISVPISFYGSR